MDPDLVGPAGHQVEVEQRPVGEPLADAVAGHRRPAVRDDRHLGAVFRVAPDRRLDPADRRRDAPLDERLVGLLDPTGLELGHDRGLRGVVPRDHQQTARVAVEAVDDPGPLDTGDPAPGRSVAVGEQGVDQGVAGMTGRRVDDEPGGLVEDQQVVVLVDDRQRDLGRRLEVERRRLGDIEAQVGAGRHDRVRAERLAGGGQPSVGDQLLDVAPRQPRRVGDVAVDAAARAVRHAQDADARGVRGVNHPTAARPAGPGPG